MNYSKTQLKQMINRASEDRKKYLKLGQHHLVEIADEVLAEFKSELDAPILIEGITVAPTKG